MVSAISERLLIEKPARYMTPKVPISDTGTATLGISVARPLRRNRNTTSTTSATEIISARPVSRSDARIVVVRSIASVTVIALGIDARSGGSIAVTRSTVSMMLALGWRLMMTSTEGRPLAMPALRKSCTESTTSATSVSRTAAPLR